MYKFFGLLLFTCATLAVRAQGYSLVIKGGTVIDPKNNINEVMDVAVADGKIARVAKDIDARGALQVVDAHGLLVIPGMVDMHTHVFFGTDPARAYDGGSASVPPDVFGPRTGVTTVVDAGCSGWKDFPTFKREVIDRRWRDAQSL